MITYQEILKRFSRILGIAESEGRLSVEIFAKDFSQKFEFGDEIEIGTLGYFSLKKMKSGFGEHDEYQNVLLFSEERISQQNKNALIFFLPEQKSAGFSSIDSYLNLSLGKTLLDPEQIKDTQFAQSSSANEFMALVESKVEKLISQSTIFQHTSEAEQEYAFPKISEENIAKVEKVDDQITIDLGNELETNAELPLEQIDSVSASGNIGFELVESEQLEPYDELNSENKDKPKWIFDDTALKNEIENQDDNVEIERNYSVPSNRASVLSVSEKTNAISRANQVEPVPQKRKRGFSNRIVFGILAFILLAAVSIAVYLNYDMVRNYIRNYTAEQPQIDESRRPIATNVIARTSELFAPSPSVINDSNVSTLHDSMIIGSEVYGLKSDSLNASATVNEENAASTKESTGTIIKVGDNIYKKGTEYIVQISSWKSRLKAESELKKLKSKGYSATLEELTSSDLGTIYQVRVSGFKSINEANDFSNLNK